MSDIIYDGILNLYRGVKHFPEKGYLITNPKKTGITNIKGKATGQYIALDALVYGTLFTVLSIMIIASVINYEVIFRPKARDATKDYNEDVDYYAEYYSKPENAIGRYFYAPVLTIIILILFRALFYYNDIPKEMPFFFIV
jgi:uncharacterized membrane protein